MELKEIIIFGIIALVLIVVLLTGYVKAPPDTAFIISGIKKRILIGKAGVRIPFFERLDKLKLAVVAIDVKTTSAVPTADYINVTADANVTVKIAIDVKTTSAVPTADYINVTADANVTVKISSDKELIKIAAENFLNKNTDYVATMAREILEGNMREIVGQLTLEQMVSDRKAFADKVQENSDPELRKLGLEIKSFNIQNFTDAQGLIDNLGIDNTAKIQKKAAIVKAEAEKEIEIAQSEAKKLANDARVLAETEIAQKNNELAIRQAELKKDSDIKKAQADAAYKIQEQEQRKTVEKTTADATLVQLDMDITLKERAAQIKEKELEASIKKQAEADKYAIQQKADADLYDTQKQSEANLFERQKKAEAERYEQEQQAEAKKAQAEALKFSMEQEADGIRAKGEAEAAATQAKALAEAEGILKKAEAMQQYGEAATMNMQIEALKVYFEQLPAIAEAVAKPMSQIDTITMYGEGNTAKLTGDITKTITQVTSGLKDAGIDISAILSGMLGGSLVSKRNLSDENAGVEEAPKAVKIPTVVTPNLYTE